MCFKRLAVVDKLQSKSGVDNQGESALGLIVCGGQARILIVCLVGGRWRFSVFLGIFAKLQVVSFVPSRSLNLRPRSYFESLPPEADLRQHERPQPLRQWLCKGLVQGEGIAYVYEMEVSLVVCV